MTFEVGSLASVEARLASTDGIKVQHGRCFGAIIVLRWRDAHRIAIWRRPFDYRCWVGNCCAHEGNIIALVDIPVPSHEGNVRHSASEPTGGHVHNVPRKRSQALGVQLVVATS